MSAINWNVHDRWGNQIFSYAFARAYAQRVGATLHTSPWLGELIFDIDDPMIERLLPKRYDMDLEQWNGESDIELTGWHQHQKHLIYTRAWLRDNLRFKPQIMEFMERAPKHDVAAHVRHGDYLGVGGYVSIRPSAYKIAAAEHKINPDVMVFLTEENPGHVPQLDEMGLGFLADFATLMFSRILFRGNSTFSWWAATLGVNDAVFSPDLTGIPINGLRHVPFRRGNHWALSKYHPNQSDLLLPET